MNKISLEKISFWVFLVASFVLPLFVFSPMTGSFLDVNKKFFLFSAVIISFIFWLLARFEDGKFSFPGGKIFLSYVLLFFVLALSAIFSSSMAQSVFGLGFEADTLISCLVFVVLMFLASVFFQTRQRLLDFLFAFIVSLFTVFLLELAQYFFGWRVVPEMGSVANVVGKWNDFGIFFGLGAIFSVVAIEHVKDDSLLTKILWCIIGFSLLFVGMVSFNSLTLVLAALSFILFVYFLSINGLFKGLGEGYKKKVKLLFKPSFIVFAVCLAFYFFGPKIGLFLQDKGVVTQEVRPSWTATWTITKSSMNESWKNYLIGAGPNRFSDKWATYKPAGVKETAFWNTDFSVGVGRVPSLPATVGLLGTLAWLLFILLPVYYAIKLVFFSSAENITKSTVMASLIAYLYLWIFSAIYFTGTVILALTFISGGILVALLVKAGAIGNFEFSYLKDPRVGFAAVLILVVLVIATVSGGYTIFNKFYAYRMFDESLRVINNDGNIDKAENLLDRAIARDPQDVYYRALSEVEILRMRQILNEQGVDQKALYTKLQGALEKASASSRKAIELNDTNYLNWFSLGKVGEAVVPLKVVQGAYTLALDSYNKALELSPNNPMVLLGLGRLELANNNIPKAREYVDKALIEKTNYREALVLLSQIEASKGNLSEAIEKIEQALIWAPNDIGTLLQLGVLKYTKKDYDGAIETLDKVIALNPQYANAKYFLGLSYSKLGKEDKALEIFKEIKATNPNNAEIQKLIDQLSK